MQLEAFRRASVPQSQRVHRLVLIAGNRHVKRYRQHFVSGFPVHDMQTGFRIDIVTAVSAKAHDTGVFRTSEFPWIAARTQPVIRFFHLKTIMDQLTEHAVFIAQAIAHHRQLQSGATVNKACSQTTQTTIAQPGINFFLLDNFQLLTQVGQCFFHIPFNAQIKQVIAQ